MHWSACFLPDDYLRKMKQDIKEVEAQVEARARYEPFPDDHLPDDDQLSQPDIPSSAPSASGY